ARVDARLHRVALDADVEGRQRVFDEVAVQVYPGGYFVLGGRREAGGDPAFDERAGQPRPAPGQVDSDDLHAQKYSGFSFCADLETMYNMQNILLSRVFW